MNEISVPVNILNHYKRRAAWKKFKRQKCRQLAGQEKESREISEQELLENSPSYWEKLLKEEYISQVAHREWEHRESVAQSLWKKKQAKLAAETQKRDEEERRIREEWQRREDEIQQKEEERRRNQDDLLRQATVNENLEGSADPSSLPWHNPFAPTEETANAIASSTSVDQLSGEPCPFFKKTSACRFGVRCSRLHDYPTLSSVLILPNMFRNFGLEELSHKGRGQDKDIKLEIDDSDLDEDYQTFFDDVIGEFFKCGRVKALWTCRNLAPHLRGTVYLEYHNEEAASKAHSIFSGRWFAGIQLECHFATIPSWREAICGLNLRERCPKGDQCNFLHPFVNPEKSRLPNPLQMLRIESSRRNIDDDRSSRRHGYTTPSSIQSSSRRSRKPNNRSRRSSSRSRQISDGRKNNEKDSSRARSRHHSLKLQKSYYNRTKSRSKSKESKRYTKSSDGSQEKSRPKSNDGDRNHRHVRSRSNSEDCDQHRYSHNRQDRSRSNSKDGDQYRYTRNRRKRSRSNSADGDQYRYTRNRRKRSRSNSADGDQHRYSRNRRKRSRSNSDNGDQHWYPRNRRKRSRSKSNDFNKNRQSCYRQARSRSTSINDETRSSRECHVTSKQTEIKSISQSKYCSVGDSRGKSRSKSKDKDQSRKSLESRCRSRSASEDPCLVNKSCENISIDIEDSSCYPIEGNANSHKSTNHSSQKKKKTKHKKKKKKLDVTNESTG